MSILNSIKELLGIPSEHEAFDHQLVIHINTVFAILKQIGIGNSNFVITGADETWELFLEDHPTLNLEDVKSYMYLKVRMMFDPPASGTASGSFEKLISELEWRLCVEAEQEVEES